MSARKTCSECPWRRDVKVGKFPPSRYAELAETVEQDFGPIFACHMSTEGQDTPCVGYLMRDGENNFRVRLMIFDGDVKLNELSSDAPLYDNFAQMARANGLRIPRNR